MWWALRFVCRIDGTQNLFYLYWSKKYNFLYNFYGVSNCLIILIRERTFGRPPIMQYEQYFTSQVITLLSSMYHLSTRVDRVSKTTVRQSYYDPTQEVPRHLNHLRTPLLSSCLHLICLPVMIIIFSLMTIHYDRIEATSNGTTIARSRGIKLIH